MALPWGRFRPRDSYAHFLASWFQTTLVLLEEPLCFLGTWWDIFSSSWMYVLGLLLALSTGQANPIPVMLALNWGIIALIIVFFLLLPLPSGYLLWSDVFLNLFPRFQEKLITLFFGLEARF